MIFQWLKHYMPRGLYGRAALILILPVVTMQLVVSVVFIQRHFEGVTAQMTQSLALELRLVLDQMEGLAGQGDALEAAALTAAALEITPKFVDISEPVAIRRWFDFSGTVVIRELSAALPELSVVQLPDDRQVRAFVDTDLGMLTLDFHRRRVSASNPHQLLVNMVFFGGLMTLIAFVYLRNQLRPIRRLARAAEAFGRGRHLNYAPSGASEVRAAGNAFLDMRARIERQIEQRTMMLSGVSHDLRTPLTRLRLALSFLEEEERAPMERDVDDMQHMLDEFLSFARGASEGEAEKMEIRAFVAEIVQLAAKGGTNVTLKPGKTEAIVPIRRLAMQRAIENLISNAVRYGKTCLVSVKVKSKSLVIRVEDDGPGIPAEQRSDALKPFMRLEAARNQNLGSGVGLGLSIAADTARAHGGVLRLGESEALGGLCADIVIAV